MHRIFLDVNLSLPESIPSAFHVGLRLLIARVSVGEVLEEYSAMFMGLWVRE